MQRGSGKCSCVKVGGAKRWDAAGFTKCINMSRIDSWEVRLMRSCGFLRAELNMWNSALWNVGSSLSLSVHTQWAHFMHNFMFELHLSYYMVLVWKEILPLSAFEGKTDQHVGFLKTFKMQNMRELGCRSWWHHHLSTQCHLLSALALTLECLSSNATIVPVLFLLLCRTAELVFGSVCSWRKPKMERSGFGSSCG